MFKYFVADATLFDFIIWFHTVHWCRERVHRTYIIFAWGLRCGCTLKMTGSLIPEDLSCCDCLGLK
jgi:hypothetical protein